MSAASSRRSSSGVIRLRRIFLVVAVLLVIGIVIGIARFDFGDKLGELTLPLRHEDIIRQQAAEKGVPADLIAAVIYEESKFEDQTSSAGARGLMQITPDTADTIENLSGGETFVYDDLADPISTSATERSTSPTCSTSTTATWSRPSPHTTPARATPTPGVGRT